MKCVFGRFDVTPKMMITSFRRKKWEFCFLVLTLDRNYAGAPGTGCGDWSSPLNLCSCSCELVEHVSTCHGSKSNIGAFQRAEAMDGFYGAGHARGELINNNSSVSHDITRCIWLLHLADQKREYPHTRTQNCCVIFSERSKSRNAFSSCCCLI